MVGLRRELEGVERENRVAVARYVEVVAMYNRLC